MAGLGHRRIALCEILCFRIGRHKRPVDSTLLILRIPGRFLRQLSIRPGQINGVKILQILYVSADRGIDR